MNSGLEYIKNFSIPLNDKINELLNKYLNDSSQLELGHSSRVLEDLISLSFGGKKVRGGLIKLAFDICKDKNGINISETQVLNIASAIEIFHTSILVHDDVMDRALKRRNVETIHSKYSRDKDLHYGESMAICGGDAGFYISWDIILNSGNDFEIISNVSKLYSEYCIRLVYGQILDITGENISALHEEDVIKVYKYKTAEYTGVLPLLIGYSIAKCNDTNVYHALNEYGYAFGWIFQLQDDFLDLFAEESDTGKIVGKDIEEGKNTLLMCYFDKHASIDQMKFKESIFGKPNLKREDLERMKKYLMESGAISYLDKLKADYMELGRNAIDRITANLEYKKILTDLLEFVATRKN